MTCGSATGILQSGNGSLPIPKSESRSWILSSGGSMRTTFRASSPMNAFRSSLRKEVELEESKSADVDRFLSVVERYTDIPELTPCILHEFVEKIIVHAAATRRARTGRRRSTFTTRVSEPWKCQKSRHQWKNEKTVQPKLYRSLFPHDVFLSGAALPLFSFYSMLSLCSDRCKSKFRPRVQPLRMYT